MDSTDAPDQTQQYIYLPHELIDDLLCTTLAVWHQSDPDLSSQHDAICTLVPVSRHSLALKQLVARRMTVDHVANYAAAHGKLDHIQAILKYGGPLELAQSGGADGADGADSPHGDKAAALILAAAAICGHVHVLEWWFATAAAARASFMRGRPRMPDLVELLAIVCKYVVPEWDDDARHSLCWLKDHGYLPAHEALERVDFDHGDRDPWYMDMYFEARSKICMRVGRFIIEHYGTAHEVKEALLMMAQLATGDGQLSVLIDLVDGYPTDGDWISLFRTILVIGASSGNIEVLEWWRTYFNGTGVRVEQLFERFGVQVDLEHFLALEYDPDRVFLFVAQFVQSHKHSHKAVSASLIAASRHKTTHVLEWFKNTRLLACVKDDIDLSTIVRNAAMCGYPEVLDWWLNVEILGFHKRVLCSDIIRCMQEDDYFQDWWRDSGLEPKLPEDASELDVSQLFPASQTHVLFSLSPAVGANSVV